MTKSTDTAQTAGERFRAEFLARFEAPEYDYEPLLAAVCGTLDLIEQLEADIATRGLVVVGSQGQDRSNPSIAEIRHQRGALPRMIAALRLEDEDDDEIAKAGRALARARHGKQRPALSRRRVPS